MTNIASNSFINFNQKGNGTKIKNNIIKKDKTEFILKEKKITSIFNDLL